MSKVFLLLSFFFIAACQSERTCYEKNNDSLSDQAIARGEGVFLYQIYSNDDTDACDFTVIGGSLYMK